MTGLRRGICFFVTAGWLCFSAPFAHADAATPKTYPPPDFFRIALLQTWTDNPDLRAARSQLASAKDEVAYARSYWGPSAEGMASITSRMSNPDSFGASTGKTKIAQVEVTQPVWRGGRTVSSTEAAQSRVAAAEENLRASEQAVLLDAATAYMDVVRAAETVRLHINNEKVLERQREAAATRFDLGDVSKTDVSQAEARLAEARAGRVRAEGDLKQAQAAFERISGAGLAGELVRPELSFSIPSTLDEALTLADSGNPAVQKARRESEAGKHDTRALFGEILPEVNLTGTAARTFEPAFGGPDRQDTAVFKLQADIPIFSNGRASARIRQSREAENRELIAVEQVRRRIREEAIAAWEDMTASRAEVEARKAQVTAAAQAFEGMEQESSLGARTTLELLDAEQELLDAQTALVSAERDLTVSFFRLLSSTGEMTGHALGFDGASKSSDKNTGYDNSSQPKKDQGNSGN